MYLYKKTANPKNTAGKITALLCLLCGAALFILAGNLPDLFPSLVQLAGVILIGISIYVASAYLLREYTFSVTPERDFSNEETDYSEKIDFIITEKKNNRDIKVCHFGMKDITLVRTVDPKNKKQISAERKDMKRFTYNTEFAASRYIEVRASLDGEDLSIFVTYDEELLRVLSELTEQKD